MPKCTDGEISVSAGLRVSSDPEDAPWHKVHSWVRLECQPVRLVRQKVQKAEQPYNRQCENVPDKVKIDQSFFNRKDARCKMLHGTGSFEPVQMCFG